MVVGAPVTAMDADGDVLNYTLGGAAATSFRIDQETGQIRPPSHWTTTGIRLRIGNS